MKTFYLLNHRCKSSLLEITANNKFDPEEYTIVNTKMTLPNNITFSVVSGKKSYDIIRIYQAVGKFFSKRIIDVFSQFIDMSDKCYPINIKDVDMKYYAIFNLSEVPYLNRKENNFLEEPFFIDARNMNAPIFSIKDSRLIFVTEEVKDALFDNKITNIYLEECFSCSRDGYERIKKTGIWPEVHSFADRQNNRIATEYYRL